MLLINVVDNRFIHLPQECLYRYKHPYSKVTCLAIYLKVSLRGVVFIGKNTVAFCLFYNYLIASLLLGDCFDTDTKPFRFFGASKKSHRH